MGRRFLEEIEALAGIAVSPLLGLWLDGDEDTGILGSSFADVLILQAGGTMSLDTGATTLRIWKDLTVLADAEIDGDLNVSGSLTIASSSESAVMGLTLDGFSNPTLTISVSGGDRQYISLDAAEVEVTRDLVVGGLIEAEELNLDGGSPSSSNPMLRFIAKSGSTYDFFADSTGAGSDNSRLWLNTPGGGEVVIGPRSGSSRLGQIRLRTDNLVLDTSPYGGSIGYPVGYVRESGTFTPTMEGSSSNPSATYGSRGGSYIRINNVVFFHARMSVSSWSGGSGSVMVGGLPFNVVNSSDYRVVCAVMVANVTLPAGKTYFVGLMEANDNAVRLWSSGSAAYSAVSLANVGSSWEIWISGHYQTGDA